jgi:hypothetical protein
VANVVGRTNPAGEFVVQLLARADPELVHEAWCTAPRSDPGILDDPRQVKVTGQPTDRRPRTGKPPPTRLMSVFRTPGPPSTTEQVAFSVDGRPVKTAHQSPAYPMQLMLGIYEFPTEDTEPASDETYPKEFVVDHVRGYRPA